MITHCKTVDLLTTETYTAWGIDYLIVYVTHLYNYWVVLCKVSLFFMNFVCNWVRNVSITLYAGNL